MEVLVENLTFLTWQQVLMWLIGGVLIYLAIVKEMEPSLLLPMGFGAILVNLPNSGAAEVIAHLFELGIAGHELFPLLLFIGIGAMIDFQPLLANPKLMIFGAAAQFGIFFTLGLASLLGFELNDAASIAIIGAADGPTSIFVAQQLGSSYTAAIMVAAYSYMALVPMVQPPVIRLCTTQAERKIKMTYKGRPVSKTTKILFPIAVTVIGAAGAILFPMDDITGFLYLIGSVFAPMIAVQIADHFLLKRDRFAVAADGRNLVIWLVGFIVYRWLMGVDTPVGYTLPDMVLTVLLCVLAEKLCAGKKNG